MAAIGSFERQLKKALEDKQAARMPFVIVPDAPIALNITDKEFNSVYRIFTYKSQSEDVIKALRRRGYTPRIFAYDKSKWEKEAKEKSILEEEV